MKCIRPVVVVVGRILINEKVQQKKGRVAHGDDLKRAKTNASAHHWNGERHANGWMDG